MEPKSNPVNWFEIPVADFDRAKEFYEYILDIEIKVNKTENFTMGWFPWAQEGAGAAGTLMKAESYVPSHEGSMVYFSVEDIEGTLKKIEERGGKILNPKMSIGEFGFVGHFEDCEGNRVALHSTK